MRSTRRAFLAGVGASGAAALAGCTGRLTGEGAAFAASGATLPGDAQARTGYTHHRTEPSTVSQQFRRFGITRTVDVTNVISEYDRAIELSLLGQRVQAAVFATIATPKVRILGREYNPVAGMSTAELAETLQQRYANVEVYGRVESFEAPVAGATTVVSRFDAEARLLALGQPVDVHLYLSAAVARGGDFVVTVAVHPKAFGTRADTVHDLMAAVQAG